MALKPDRIELLTDVSFFMATTGNRGGIVSVVTGGSGVSMDNANAVVAYDSTVSGKPIGVLLNDVVNLDLTRQHINYHKDEVQKGGKVTVLRVGEVTTDFLVGSDAAAGSGAYVGADGKFSTSSTNSTLVGQFLSGPDADGFAKVAVNIVG